MKRYRVADFYIAYGFNTRDDIAYVSCFKLSRFFVVDFKNARLLNFVFRAAAHHADNVAGFDCAVHDAHVNNNSAIRIVMAVEYQCLQGLCSVA